MNPVGLTDTLRFGGCVPQSQSNELGRYHAILKARAVFVISSLLWVLVFSTNVGAVIVSTEVEVNTGPVTASGANQTDLGAKPESFANAAYSNAGFSTAGSAKATVDPDGLELGLEFLIGGNFDPIRRWYGARAVSFYSTPLTLVQGLGGNLSGTGSIRFRFDIHGEMNINGFPAAAPSNSVLLNLNQLRIEFGGESTVPFRVEQTAEDKQGFNTFVISDPLPLDLVNPGELAVTWLAVADIDFMSGEFTVESLFGNTARLTGVEVRNAVGVLLDVQVLDDQGRSIIAAPIPLPPSVLLFAGPLLLSGIACRRSRRQSSMHSMPA